MNPIGIFDSGIGGLTIFKEIKNKFPHQDIIYLADTAHLPYGEKSKETIIKLSLQNILFLLNFKVELIIIACNTCSAVALPSIKEYFRIPILGVIDPLVKEALVYTKNKRIGVIGTNSTIKSKSFQKRLKELLPSAKIFSKACPLFVPLIEENLTKGEIVLKIIEMYLNDFKRKNIDTLILGCTHYPLLKDSLNLFFENKVKLIDAPSSLIKTLKKFLKKEKKRPVYRFFVTDDIQGFKIKAKNLLKEEIKNIELINYV